MTITLNNPLDMHIHLREGRILENVVNYTADVFSASLVMPNLSKPITNTKMAINYKQTILEAYGKDDFIPILSLYITPQLDINELKKAKDSGIKILKLYPKGATTGSESGIDNVLDSKTLDIFYMAQELDFILSIHGESGGFSMNREYEFIPVIEEITRNFPKLKIIMEHLSDRRSIKLLEKYDNVFATITLHHILMTLDDLLGSKLNPHYFCKPILKTKQDRDALLELVLSGNHKVSFGSDSAPHVEANKLNNMAMAGIFSTPILLPKLCEIFEEHNKLENLQKFISDNAIKIYELENIPSKKVTLEKKGFKVPDAIYLDSNRIIPLLAEQMVSWSIVDIKTF